MKHAFPIAAVFCAVLFFAWVYDGTVERRAKAMPEEIAYEDYQPPEVE